MAERADSSDSSSASGSSRALVVAQVRGQLARIVWIVCLVIALVLAAAAFSYALDANAGNGLVRLIRHVAEHCDLGWFSLTNPIKRFNNPNGQVKTALFNYGIAAVVYLVVGRILERIIRP